MNKFKIIARKLIQTFERFSLTKKLMKFELHTETPNLSKKIKIKENKSHLLFSQ